MHSGKNFAIKRTLKNGKKMPIIFYLKMAVRVDGLDECSVKMVLFTEHTLT